MKSDFGEIELDEELEEGGVWIGEIRLPAFQLQAPAYKFLRGKPVEWARLETCNLTILVNGEHWLWRPRVTSSFTGTLPG